jgi:hypothetical protein
MPKDKISDYSSTANSNTDIAGINIDEGCAPSGINDAIRTLMAQLKTWQSGSQDVYIHPAGSASAPSITANGDTNTGIFFPAADTVGITTGGTERARVDSSGNMGLGVTPSAWRTDFSNKAIQVGLVGSFSSFQASTTNNQTFLTSNAVNLSGGWAYLYADKATQYVQYAGTHYWNTSGTGTAGGSVSWTQAMTLDASGNLGIGTTSPTAYSGYKTLSLNGSNGGVLEFKLGDAQQARISNSGGALLQFVTNGTEAMRIDSSGNLLVGDTSAAGRVLAKSATSDGTTSSYVAKNSSGTVLLDIISTGYFKTGVASNSPYNNATGSAANVYVGSDGALFRSTSSLKYKTNVQDATHGLVEVLQLRPVTYEGKSDFDTGKTFGGLIAEEVHAIGLTEFVQYADNGTPDALAYGNMVSLCIKAIQEQQAMIASQSAIITQLQADVAALKGQA